MTRGPNSLSWVLKSSGTARELLLQSQELQLLLTRVRKLLPATLQDHCRAVLIKKRQLILFVDSPAWSSRMRFYSRDLKTMLRRDGMGVERVSVRVMIDDPPQKRKKSAVKRLSPDNAALIRQTAEVIEDGDLSAALKRLSRHF